ncbi:unnamed protein product [Urochloa decumbens]|uniref:WASH1 WAHD domain-containing protein n=1 Tax=Urochloa decumbens TaxID=240449 RepID=A0ABC8XJY0_9POAL
MLRVSEDGDRRRTAHAAGYGDLGRALLDLQDAADQIFDAVSKRTAEEREKLSAISTRIKAAKATDSCPKAKDATYLEKFLEAAKHPAPRNHLASDAKSEELPPPPPSLLPKHLRSRRSDDVRVESDVNPAST